MDYEEIFERIQSGEKLKGIAEDLGCSTSKLQRGLKKSGFDYVSNKWIRIEGQHLNNETTTKKQVEDNKETTKQQVNNNLMTSNQFSSEEVKILKEMIANFKKIDTKEEKGLYDRIGERETGDYRNNIFLNEKTQFMFDDFIAEKNLTKKKSLIVELALEDFIKKYSE